MRRMRNGLRIGLALVAGCLALSPRVAAAQDCTLPNILVLLDVSGSMSNNSKYTQAVSGINTFMQTYQNRAQFGLGVFPRPNEGASSYGYCQIKTDGGGALQNAVDFATGNRAAFNTYLNSFGGPKSTYDTPIYQALTAASLNAGLNDPSRRTYVLLISDGQQDCCLFNDYDAEPDCKSTRPNVFDPIETQENREDIRNLAGLMKGNNITTYAIGFGSGADALTLNYVATAADTKRAPGCLENGTDASSNNNCYYRANDSGGLSAALAAIVQQINQETCDGTDEDCDGTVDNNLPLGNLCGIDTGECAFGREECIDAAWQCRNAVGPSDEICDNKDNNCNGQIDEGIASSGSCGTDVGLCSPGQLQCNRGNWVCSGNVGPQSEICDGQDNNCDGLPDNGIPCDCEPGQVRACGQTDVGECSLGQQQCVASNGGFTWGPCNAIYPVAEVCDGLDNNCNNIIDEGTDQACSTQCGPGIRSCDAGQYGACIPLSTPAEVCDGEDNNCNGQIDENSDEACQTQCGPGVKKCVSGELQACIPTNPPPEICDGLDNNCDGVVDEGCPCQQGETRPCGKNVAQCKEGIERCEFGQWSACIGADNGMAEICDGLDNNCDGLADNGEDLCGPNAVCQCGGCRPACNANGTCNNGGTCVAGVCQKDECPEGEMCSAGKCVKGTPVTPLTEPVVTETPRPALNDSKGRIRGGCGCQDSGAADGLFAAFVVGLLVVQRARRSHR